MVLYSRVYCKLGMRLPQDFTAEGLGIIIGWWATWAHTHLFLDLSKRQTMALPGHSRTCLRWKISCKLIKVHSYIHRQTDTQTNVSLEGQTRHIIHIYVHTYIIISDKVTAYYRYYEIESDRVSRPPGTTHTHWEGCAEACFLFLVGGTYSSFGALSSCEDWPPVMLSSRFLIRVNMMMRVIVVLRIRYGTVRAAVGVLFICKICLEWEISKSSS